jgi:hypothetical protein
MVASGEQSAIALTKPHLCLPANGLDDVGRVVQSSWEVSADVRGVAIGPGTFDQDATHMGGVSCGDRTLPPPGSTRGCRGCQAEVFHQRCAVIDAGEVPPLRDQSDGHRARHPASGLQRLDDRVQAPRVPVRFECWFETLQACGVFGDRAAVCLKDDGLGGCGTDDCRAPPEVGRAPGGTARRAESVPQSEGLAPGLGGLDVPDRLFARPGELTDGFIVDLGDIDRCEVT